jgi:glucose-1-phosphate cytidylyltransferase
MKTVILCGGRGTRLHEETEFRPKPLVKVGDLPIVVHIMQIFASQGFDEFVLCLGHKGEMIKNFFLNFHTMTADFTVDLKTGGVSLLTPHERGWKVSLVETGADTGTGGRILRAAPYIGDAPFMVTYGDGLADVDLAALTAHHRKAGRIATVTGVRETSRFGVIEPGDGGLVGRFREKPLLDGMISGGFFVFEPAVMDYLDDGPLEAAPLEKLASQDELALYEHEGFFRCMDTYRDYLELNELYKQGPPAPWDRPAPGKAAAAKPGKGAGRARKKK